MSLIYTRLSIFPIVQRHEINPHQTHTHRENKMSEKPAFENNPNMEVAETNKL